MIGRLSSRLWGIAHRRSAEPTMTVVLPVAQWTLPAGYSLDPATGNIRDEAGVVLSNPSAYQATMVVRVVPRGAAHSGTTIMPADITPDEVVEVAVHYADIAAVRSAQYVVWQGETYDVVDTARLTETASRLPAVVTLHRRRDDKRATWSQWDRRWNGQ